jgi:hypothetical protein
MSDARTGADDDRLPWLEAVDEEEASEGPSPVKLIAAVVIGLVAIGLVVAGLFWLGNRDGADSADGELIEAPDGPYKVQPDRPGGMQVEGQGGTAHAASEGQQPQGNLSMNVPEAPVTGNAAAPANPPVRPQAPAAQPARPQAQPAPAPAAPGATIQLGAFSTQAAANNAWRGLSGRFRYLAPLSHSVVPVQAGGRTLYRLRASGPNAADVCRRLEIAGETCTAVR